MFPRSILNPPPENPRAGPNVPEAKAGFAVLRNVSSAYINPSASVSNVAANMGEDVVTVVVELVLVVEVELVVVELEVLVLDVVEVEVIELVLVVEVDVVVVELVVVVDDVEVLDVVVTNTIADTITSSKKASVSSSENVFLLLKAPIVISCDPASSAAIVRSASCHPDERGLPPWPSPAILAM